MMRYAGAVATRPPPAAPRRRPGLTALRLGVAAVVFGYLAQVVPVGELAAHFRTMPPLWVAVAVGLHLATYGLGSCALAVLLRPHRVAATLWRILAASLASAFYNLVTPGGMLAGGAVRWYRLGYAAGKMPEVLAALVASRLLEVTSLACLACAGCLMIPLPGSGGMGGALLGLLLATVTLAYAGLFNRGLALRLVVLLRRLATVGAAPRRLALRFLRAARTQAGLSARGHAGLLALFLLRQLIGAGGVCALAVGLGLEIGFAPLVWVRSITVIVTMLPISVAGLGLREAAFVVLLHPYGVAPAEAVALALLCLTLMLVPAMAGGLLELRLLLWRRPTLR